MMSDTEAILKLLLLLVLMLLLYVLRQREWRRSQGAWTERDGSWDGRTIDTSCLEAEGGASAAELRDRAVGCKSRLVASLSYRCGPAHGWAAAFFRERGSWASLGVEGTRGRDLGVSCVREPPSQGQRAWG